jgi:hypothetical protein
MFWCAFLLLCADAYECLFEANHAQLHSSALTQTLANQGCQTSLECNSTAVPLVSFVGAEIDDMLYFTCSTFMLTACNKPSLYLQESVRSALEFVLYRTLYSVGLQNTGGYWTFSNSNGQIQNRGYINPLTGLYLTGSNIETEYVLKKWLCVCITNS